MRCCVEFLETVHADNLKNPAIHNAGASARIRLDFDLITYAVDAADTPVSICVFVHSDIKHRLTDASLASDLTEKQSLGASSESHQSVVSGVAGRLRGADVKYGLLLSAIIPITNRPMNRATTAPPKECGSLRCYDRSNPPGLERSPPSGG